MTRSSRSRRFRPTLDALPLRLAPACVAPCPLDATLIGYTPPAQDPAPEITPCDPTLVCDPSPSGTYSG